MKAIITFIIAVLFSAYSFAADNGQHIIDNVMGSISPDHSTEANFAITASGQTSPSRGVIKLQGNMMRISMPEMSLWYDGGLLWSYSDATGEVNITAPTAEELATLSPYAALAHCKSLFNIKSSQSNGLTTLILSPKDRKKSPFKEISLQINNRTYYIMKAVVKNVDGTTQTIQINNYKRGNKLPESAFKFNNAEVPSGTPIIDLR